MSKLQDIFFEWEQRVKMVWNSQPFVSLSLWTIPGWVMDHVSPILSNSSISLWTWAATWVGSDCWFNFQGKVNDFTFSLEKFERTGNLTFDPKLKVSRNSAYLMIQVNVSIRDSWFCKYRFGLWISWWGIWCLFRNFLWTSCKQISVEKRIFNKKGLKSSEKNSNLSSFFSSQYQGMTGFFSRSPIPYITWSSSFL